MLIWLDQVWYGMCSMWLSGGQHVTGIYVVEWDMQADTDLWYGCCCCALQNNSRAHIQCSEVVHGDEPASVWWMHTELQGRSTDVSWFVAQFVMSLAARLMAWIWLCQIIPNSHRQARADKTVLCRVCLGDANWILDDSRLSPTENLKSQRINSNCPIHTTMPDTTQAGLFCRVWCSNVNWVGPTARQTYAFCIGVRWAVAVVSACATSAAMMRGTDHRNCMWMYNVADIVLGNLLGNLLHSYGEWQNSSHLVLCCFVFILLLYF